MADLSDVRDTLVGVIAGMLYPNGTGQPSAIGAPCRIFPAWPLPDQLDLDMAGKMRVNDRILDNGVGPIVNVSVYPQPNMERVTNRYPREWKTLVPAAPTLTLTVADDHTVTLSGAVSTPQTLHILTGGQAFHYAVQAGDTLAGAAAALAAIINATTPAISSGATITLASGSATKASVSANGAAIKEIGRQQRSFMVTIWSPTPALVDAAAKLIDPALRLFEFLALPDGSHAWLVYRGTNPDDKRETTSFYRRDLLFWAEYPTTVTETETSISVVQENLKAGQTPDAATPVQINFGG